MQQTNLPALLTPLIGRERDEAAVRDLLAQSQVRLVTLTGPPGIGKTRLALQVTAAMVGDFEDGIYMVELAPVIDPDQVPPTIARTLGLKEAANQSLEDALLAYLRERRVLLLLDNFEQVLDAAPYVVKLLQTSPWLKALITSREALRVRGERRFLVPSLEVPRSRFRVPGSRFQVSNEAEQGTWNPEPGTLMGYSSVELFVSRVQDTVPTFVLTEANAEDVAAVCAALEGVPLAIELAAARAEHLSPGEISAGLVSRLEMLTEGARDLPARHRTLRGAIEWSYNLLDNAEMTLFRQLGVFVGGFSLEAVETVCRRVGATPTAQILSSLAERSLVKEERHSLAQHSATPPRWTMLEIIREYALEKLWDSGEGDLIDRGHALYFMRLVEEAEPHLRSGEQLQWLTRLEQEHDNIRAALQWAREHRGGPARHEDDGDRRELPEAAEIQLRLAGAMARFWHTHGYLREGRAQLAAALSLGSRFLVPGSRLGVDNLEPGTRNLEPYRARALNGAGAMAYEQGDYDAADLIWKEALALRRTLDDKLGVANSLNNLGLLAHGRGDTTSARALYEESLAIKRELGDKVSIAQSLNNLGFLAWEQGDYAAAQALLGESLTIKRELDDKGGIGTSLHGLGLIAWLQGDYAAARYLFEESLAVRRELGDNVGVASSLHGLGIVVYEQGDHTLARSLHQESLAIRRKMGSNLVVIENLASLGRLAAGVGEVLRGAKLLGATAKLWEVMAIEPERDVRRQYELGLASTRSLLGEEEFGRAWAEGQAMTMEEAIAYALDEG